ncbi:hypothetical protein WISP_17409 [Willisornis vidua]|uniref:Uncharacterized protein n=1 Tax=Willisornis vidua TaxID=1566151 RepID=A0ABQ9DPF5_9PASS|nr:hypothetical protein WISP_17409 [Willisornis vidua]
MNWVQDSLGNSRSRTGHKATMFAWRRIIPRITPDPGGSSEPERCDGTELSEVDVPEEWNAIQRELDKLEKRAQGNLMRFSKAKCKALHSR